MTDIIAMVQPFVSSYGSVALVSRRFRALSCQAWQAFDVGRVCMSMHGSTQYADFVQMLCRGRAVLTGCREFTGFMYVPNVVDLGRISALPALVDDHNAACQVAILNQIANPDSVRVYAPNLDAWDSLRASLARYSGGQLQTLWLFVRYPPEYHGPFTGVRIKELRSLTAECRLELLREMCRDNPNIESLTLIASDIDSHRAITIDEILQLCGRLRALHLTQMRSRLVEIVPPTPVTENLTTLSLDTNAHVGYTAWIAERAPNLEDVTLLMRGDPTNVNNIAAMRDVSQLKKITRLSIMFGGTHTAPPVDYFIALTPAGACPRLATFEVHDWWSAETMPDANDVPDEKKESELTTMFGVDITPVLEGRAVTRLVADNVSMRCAPTVFRGAMCAGLGTIVYRVTSLEGETESHEPDLIALVSRGQRRPDGTTPEMKFVLPCLFPKAFCCVYRSCVTHLEIKSLACMDMVHPTHPGLAPVFRRFPHLRTVRLRRWHDIDPLHLRFTRPTPRTSAAIAAIFLLGAPTATIWVLAADVPEVHIRCVRPLGRHMVGSGSYRYFISDALGVADDTRIDNPVTIEYV